MIQTEKEHRNKMYVVALIVQKSLFYQPKKTIIPIYLSYLSYFSYLPTDPSISPSICRSPPSAYLIYGRIPAPVDKEHIHYLDVPGS